MYKICFPSTSPHAAGSNLSTLLLASELNQLGYESIFVYPPHGTVKSTLKNKNVTSYELALPRQLLKVRTNYANSSMIGKLGAAFSVPSYVYQCFKFLRSQKIDIVHTNDLMGTIVWGIAAKICGLPLIWHMRQEESSKVLDRLRFRLADRIIFVTKTHVNKFQKISRQRQNYFRVIHNGVDTKLFSPSWQSGVRDELGIEPSIPVVGFVGQLTERKRPDLFVEVALKILNTRRVHFLVVGPFDKDYKQSLMSRIVREGREDSFTFLGHKEDIAPIFSSIDILLFTSRPRGEAFPRVIIEAMACSIPVVATDVSGVSEAIKDGETGFLVDPANTIDLVEKTICLIDDPELREKFGSLSRSRAVKKFDSRLVTTKVVSLYEDLRRE